MRLLTLALGLIAMATQGHGFEYGVMRKSTLPGQAIGFYADAPPENSPLPTMSYRIGFRLAKHGTAGVPFILWPNSMEPLQETAGYWVVVLPPQEAAGGRYEVKAGASTCIVSVAPVVVPPARCTFGFYYEEGRLPPAYRTDAWSAAYYRDMAAHGHNSVTFFDYTRAFSGDTCDWSQTTLDERLDSAIAQGLCHPDHPAILLPGNVTKLAGADLRKAVQAREDWPEILLYGSDEPGVGRGARGVIQQHRLLQSTGMRVTTAINRKAILQYAGVLDVWLMLASDIPRQVQQLAASNKATLGTYDCRIRGTNYRINRWYAGVFTWALYLEHNWVWAYTHHPGQGVFADGTYNLDISNGYVLPSPDGPLPTIGYEGRRDGILDYRILCAAEEIPEAAEWLADLRKKVPRDSFTERGYFWDVPDTHDPQPAADLDKIRARCLDYLMQKGDADA